jgi:hypothetical protein
MKKLFIAVAAMFVAAGSFAQSKTVTPFEVSIGAEGGLPLGDFKETSKFGYGGSVKFAYNTDPNVAITLQSGYLSFSGKTIGLFEYPRLGFIPVKLGGRYTFPGGLYLEPQFGVTFINENVGTGFTYAGNLGYHMVPGIDISARYEGISKDGTVSFIGFRVAYAFGSGK